MNSQQSCHMAGRDGCEAVLPDISRPSLPASNLGHGTLSSAGALNTLILDGVVEIHEPVVES